MPIVFARHVSDDIHAGLRDIAFLADLSMAVVVAAIAADTLGIPHPHTAAVKRAARTWRAGRNA